MFLESRATSARMSTPSMTSPMWLYCGFPEQGKKIRRNVNAAATWNTWRPSFGESRRKPERLWAPTVEPCSASTQLMVAEKKSWGTYFFSEKKNIYVSNSCTDFGGLHNDHRGVYSLKTRLKIDLGFTQISTVKSQSTILPTLSRRRIPKPKSCHNEWKGPRYEGKRCDCSQAPRKIQSGGGLLGGIFTFQTGPFHCRL